MIRLPKKTQSINFKLNKQINSHDTNKKFKFSKNSKEIFSNQILYSWHRLYETCKKWISNDILIILEVSLADQNLKEIL